LGLLSKAAKAENRNMRYTLYAVIAGVILFFAVYKYSDEMPVDKRGTTLAEAYTQDRVRMDLTGIASAENENITVHSVCLSLEDLITSQGLEKARTERDGYTYSIRCNEQEFVVVATPPLERAGAKSHNPVITVDKHLEIREER
jgi:hypothetical protein